MISEIGLALLIASIITSTAQFIIPLLGFITSKKLLIDAAKPLAISNFVYLSIAMGMLIYGFLVDDFSIKYISENSNTRLPDIFKVSASWGAHEGSLLLWTLILSLWTVAVVAFSRQIPDRVLSHILMVLGFISLGFVSFLFFTSNPFDVLSVVPLEGRELNPLLQDFGLIIHPPLLYMGYVGMAIPFSFALSALIRGEVDSSIIRWVRPWTLMAWSFLTMGIVLGSWWAYYELGWGGWWFWDPVENASFMPWLIATALIHSLSVTEKRGSFKHWTILLSISAFSLSLLGTFLVRSGILTSVHSFASDPTRGVFILSFLVFVIGGSLLLYAIRQSSMNSQNKFNLVSRETGLLLNNLFLVTATITVLIGTLYPLVLDTLGLGKISVGAPYFNSVFVPIMIPAIILMAIAPFLRWKSDTIKRLKTSILLSTMITMALSIIMLIYIENIYSVIAWSIFSWITLHSLYILIDRVRKKGVPSLSFIGMIFGHMGIAVFVIGATITTQYGIEKDVALSVGQSETINEYEITFQGVSALDGANYTGTKAKITFKNMNTGNTGTLYPEKRLYSTGMPMTEAAIHPTISRDIYVAIGEHISGDEWSLRVYYKPLIRLIWLGGIFIVIGGILSSIDKRYRNRSRKTVRQSNIEIAKDSLSLIETQLNDKEISKERFKQEKIDIESTLATEIKPEPEYRDNVSNEKTIYAVIISVIAIIAVIAHYVSKPPIQEKKIDLKTHLIKMSVEGDNMATINLSLLEYNSQETEEAIKLAKSASAERQSKSVLANLVMLNITDTKSEYIDDLRKSILLNPELTDEEKYTSSLLHIAMGEKNKAIDILNGVTTKEASILLDSLNSLTGKLVSVSISIPSASKHKYLMVYAISRESRMPIIIKKILVKDYIGYVELSNVDAIQKTNPLDSSPTLKFYARLSNTGSAKFNVGDLESHTDFIKIDSTQNITKLDLTISTPN